MSISNNRGHFFQSDRDLKNSEIRTFKSKLPSHLVGDPVDLKSKTLYLLHSELLKDQAILAHSTGAIRFFGLKDKETKKLIRAHTTPVTCLDICQYEGKLLLASGAWDKTVKIWDIKTGKLLHTLIGHNDFIKTIKFRINPQSELTLYSGSSDGDIRLWSISKDSGKCQAVMKSNSGTIENLQLSYDNATLFSCGSGDLSIKQWDLETLQVINTFEGHLTTVYKIWVDEDVMWSASADKTIKRWNLVTKANDVTFDHDDTVKSMCIWDKYLLTGGRDEKVYLWNIESDELITHYQGHWDEIMGLTVLPKDKANTVPVVISTGLDGTIRYFDIEKYENLDDFINKLEIPEEKLKDKSQGGVEMTEDEERELMELMSDEE